jgi:hypothetical protein
MTDLGFSVRQRKPQIATIVGQFTDPIGEYIRAVNQTGLSTQCRYQKPNTIPVIPNTRLTGAEFLNLKFSSFLKYAFTISTKKIEKIRMLGAIIYFMEIIVAERDIKAINELNTIFLLLLNIRPTIMTAKYSMCTKTEKDLTPLVTSSSMLVIC